MSFFAAALFDRDGTLIRDKHYLADPAGVELLPGTGEALAALAQKGTRLFLVSNQSGVGRGMFSLEAVRACNKRLAKLLLPYGVVFEDMVFCPHAPEEGCGCRKPATGMWRELEKAHSLTSRHCVMIGDKEEDMLFAANAGLAARVLVLTGKGRAVAERLSLPLPGIRPAVYPHPISPSHPHLCIPDLGMLENGLNLLEAGAQRQWNA